VTATLGCGDSFTDSAQVLSCMRSKDYQDVLDAIPPSSDLVSIILGYFGPTVDDVVIFSNYSERTPSDIPLLIGNNNYEVGLFRTEFAITGLTLPDRLWDAIDLQEFTCPAGIRANASVVAKNPTWRYRYFGVFPDLAISTEAGTWHAAEVPILFDTMPINPAPTAEEISIANYMRGAWATFAKDPEKGLSTYKDGWPTYDASKETLIRLAYNNITGTNLALPSLYDALCVYVNVSSTDESAYLSIPTAVPSATVSSSTGPSVESATGSAPSSTSTTAKSGGLRVVGMSTAMLLGTLVVALFLL
jgi:cholinesterase